MAEGIRNGGTDRARRALETCMARIRRGQTVAQALADCPDDGGELRSLLATFERLRDAAVTPPEPPRGLTEGRARFLAAADALRTASAAVPADAAFAAEAEALDRAIAGEPSGASSELDGLAVLAGALRRDARPVPAQNGALAAGRGRFLAAAGALRAARSEVAEAADVEGLDAALARVAAGDPVAAAAAGTADPARLAGLLEVARELRAASVPAPAPARGRAAFLAAAQGLAVATGRAPAEAGVDAETLDAALARLLAGEPAASIVAAAEGPAAEALAGLLRTATDVAAAAPAPAADLGAGRARLLEAAGGVRALRGAGRVAPAAMPAAAPRRGLAGWIQPLRPRIAALAAALTLALFAGNAVLVPVSAGARPGDGLLYRHKLLMQDLRLAVATVNPRWRSEVQAEISRERLADIAAAGPEDVEVSVDGRLRGFEDLTQPGEKGHGLIHVAALGDDGERALTAAWRDGQTRISLPEGLRSLADVPAGAPLRLKIRTGEEPPLALKVALLGLDPLVPLTATMTVTATASATPTLPSETPTLEPTLTATASPTATLGATSTVPPSPTPSATAPTPTPTATVRNPVETRAIPRGQELEGQVLQIGPTDWTVRRAANVRKGDPDAVAIDVRVTMAGLANAQALASVEVGDRVRLRGEYQNGQRDVFAATKLIGHVRRDVACRDRGAVLGVVARYQPGAGLVLADGTTFEFDATALPEITGEIQVGATVVVTHQECGGRLVARAVAVTSGGPSQPESREFNGVVRTLVDERTMELEVGGTRYTVRFDPATVTYLGEPIVLAVGQRVGVWGRVVDEAAAVVEAERVVVLRLAEPPTPEPPTPTMAAMPTATDEPPPSATPGSTPTPGLLRPEPLPPGAPGDEA